MEKRGRERKSKNKEGEKMKKEKKEERNQVRCCKYYSVFDRLYIYVFVHCTFYFLLPNFIVFFVLIALCTLCEYFES